MFLGLARLSFFFAISLALYFWDNGKQCYCVDQMLHNAGSDHQLVMRENDTQIMSDLRPVNSNTHEAFTFINMSLA